MLSSYDYTVSPGYFEAAGRRLLEGRDVSWHDTTGTPLCRDREPDFRAEHVGRHAGIGQRFIFLDQLREVVGVVEDGKYDEMTESPQPAVFLPWSQNEQITPTFVVRSHRAQNELAPAIQQALHALEPDALVTGRVGPMRLRGCYFRREQQPSRWASWACWRRCWR